MVTKTWKVFGYDGHRQKISFGKSFRWDFTSPRDGIRILDCECSDKTGTNAYVILRITRSTAELCERELDGQLSDGIFENCRYGDVVEVA